jgi:hypothetical protein
MNIDEYVKSFVNAEVPLDYVWEQTQKISSEMGIDLQNGLDEPTARFIAEEIDKVASGSLAARPEAAMTIEKKKTKKEKNANNGSVEKLKPAVANLKTAVEQESTAMLSVFDAKAQQVENAVAAKILDRCKAINPNIISLVSNELEGYTRDSASFREQIGQIFDETFAGLLGD